MLVIEKSINTPNIKAQITIKPLLFYYKYYANIKCLNNTELKISKKSGSPYYIETISDSDSGNNNNILKIDCINKFTLLIDNCLSNR